MGRKAPIITMDEFKQKLGDTARRAAKEELTAEEMVNPWESAFSFLWFENASIRDDLRKVQFDFENYSSPDEDPNEYDKRIVGFHQLPNGMPFVGCWAGGDWEMPVYFILYWDGKKIRGYIPESGNTFNVKSRTAYGSEGDSEIEFTDEELAAFEEAADQHDGWPKPDEDAYLNDIQARIEIRA